MFLGTKKKTRKQQNLEAVSLSNSSSTLLYGIECCGRRWRHGFSLSGSLSNGKHTENWSNANVQLLGYTYQDGRIRMWDDHIDVTSIHMFLAIGIYSLCTLISKMFPNNQKPKKNKEIVNVFVFLAVWLCFVCASWRENVLESGYVR